ncbi:phage tail sheath subtilisin-like domain-containing protein [Oculatella sp. FACHB-28]|uniref:phage tail sheath subtilisin-like domain-containing protein n=1 Tax=Oculatella sp. FACHB-28 TaxID=2692845 RepID=UPI00168505F0|nr:phage tail sheath subtilisin-like domain-containing protein [Oculatella sp. FACHB-28]
MIGSSAEGDFLKPTQVTNLTDFTNVFGESPSTDSVKLYFRNDRRGILYFVRTPIAEQIKVKVDTASTGDYTLTVQGIACTHTATGTSTPATIATGLISAVNTAAGSQVTAVAGAATDELIIRSDNPLTDLTVVATLGDVTLTSATPASPTAVDYVYAIENTFDYEDEWPQGYIIAPEAFQLLNQSGRLSVGIALHDLAVNEKFDWMAIADCGDETITIAQAAVDGQQYTAPQGHLSYYFPYVIDLEDEEVPPSSAVAGVATLRHREQGFHQPAAGAKYAVKGVKDVKVRVNTQQQDTLNPLGINIVRNLRNKGIVIWGMRTRSADTFYTQAPGRIVMNVLNGSLRKGFDFELFNSIDGEGVALHLIDQAATSICRLLWVGKALFGADEEEAFEVRCNFENNTDANLDQGNVLVEVWVATSPAVEKILINTVKVPIRQVQAAANQNFNQAA